MKTTKELRSRKNIAIGKLFLIRLEVEKNKTLSIINIYQGGLTVSFFYGYITARSHSKSY